MIDLKSDPRWMRLNDPAFTWGNIRGGMFDLNADKPAAWQGGGPVSGDDAFDPNNFLAEDFCVIDDRQFYIRGVIELPILGGGGKSLAYAVWAEVSRPSFGGYLKTFDLPDQGNQPPLVGTFANQLPGFTNTLGQPCTLRPRNAGARPLLTLSTPAHPLAEQQARGITLDRMLDLFAAAGQDVRPSLSLNH